jgi:hypothetical protein
MNCAHGCLSAGAQQPIHSLNILRCSEKTRFLTTVFLLNRSINSKSLKFEKHICDRGHNCAKAILLTCFCPSNFPSHLSAQQPLFRQLNSFRFQYIAVKGSYSRGGAARFRSRSTVALTVTRLSRAHLCGTDRPNSLRLRPLAAGGINCTEG